MLHFVEIGSPVLEKKIFKGFFFIIYGRGGHLGRVAWMIHTHISSASYKIWLWLAKWFQRRRRCLNMVERYMFILYLAVKLMYIKNG